MSTRQILERTMRRAELLRRIDMIYLVEGAKKIPGSKADILVFIRQIQENSV